MKSELLQMLQLTNTKKLIFQLEKGTVYWQKKNGYNYISNGYFAVKIHNNILDRKLLGFLVERFGFIVEEGQSYRVEEGQSYWIVEDRVGIWNINFDEMFRRDKKEIEDTALLEDIDDRVVRIFDTGEEFIPIDNKFLSIIKNFKEAKMYHQATEYTSIGQLIFVKQYEINETKYETAVLILPVRNDGNKYLDKIKEREKDEAQ